MQSGTRFPMLLDLATRSVSGPLDIRGDHSDLYFALNTGWLIFLARDPQAVYDLNLIALRVAERPEVQLPAIVAFDGFFTSHQKRRVQTFADARVGAGVPGAGARARDGARPAAPGHDRAVHERSGPDQQQVPAQARDGRGPPGHPRGLRRVRGAQRPPVSGRRPLPDGGRRRRGAPSQLRRGDGEGRRRHPTRAGRARGCDQPERDPPLPRRGDPGCAAPRPRRPDRRAGRLLRRQRREHLPRGQVRAEGRSRQRDSLPDPRLRSRRPRLLRRRRRGVLRPGARGGRDGTRRDAVRLPRRRRGRPGEAVPDAGSPGARARDSGGPREGRGRRGDRDGRRSRLLRTGSSPGARSASRRATAPARAAGSSPRSTCS